MKLGLFSPRSPDGVVPWSQAKLTILDEVSLFDLSLPKKVFSTSFELTPEMLDPGDKLQDTLDKVYVIRRKLHEQAAVWAREMLKQAVEVRTMPDDRVKDFRRIRLKFDLAEAVFKSETLRRLRFTVYDLTLFQGFDYFLERFNRAARRDASDEIVVLNGEDCQVIFMVGPSEKAAFEHGVKGLCKRGAKTSLE